MNLVSVSVESIQLGQPLPFNVLGKDGLLLAKKSLVIKTRADLMEMYHRGEGLFMDAVDGAALHRAYVDRLQTLLRNDKPLGEIAESKLSSNILKRPVATAQTNSRLDWPDLQEQVSYLLRDTHPASFAERLEHIDQVLLEQIRRHADSALFALIHLSATEAHMYSATHAMLVSVMCGLAAHEVFNWPEPVQALLRKAALTMNMGMTDLQDRLSVQTTPLTAEQRELVNGHTEKSVHFLSLLGVADKVWLDAVRGHHIQSPGALRDKTPSQRLARVIQRADMFAARLAPRASRMPVAPAAAMQASYFDELKQVDEAGAALIKAVGIYQPGSYVKLATNEVAVVVKRGHNTTTPRVAVLVNRSGIAIVEPIIRDTANKEHRIVASVPHRDVRVKINLDRALPLTQGPTLERVW